MTEKEAEAEILRRCRATPIGRWVMRSYPTDPIPAYDKRPDPSHTVRVVDLSPRGGDPTVASGVTWLDVLAALPEKTR